MTIYACVVYVAEALVCYSIHCNMPVRYREEMSNSLTWNGETATNMLSALGGGNPGLITLVNEVCHGITHFYPIGGGGR